jgi:hypothetical protein
LSNKIEGLNLPDSNQPGVLSKPQLRQEKPYERPATKEVIDEVRFASPLDDASTSRFQSVTEFLDDISSHFLFYRVSSNAFV